MIIESLGKMILEKIPFTFTNSVVNATSVLNNLLDLTLNINLFDRRIQNTQRTT